MSGALQALKDPFATDYPSFLDEVVLPPGVKSAQEQEKEQEQEESQPPKKKKQKILREVPQCGAFSEKGSYLLLGSLVTGRIVIRDMVTRYPVATHQCHESTLTSVSYLPNCNSKLILTTSVDGFLKVWDLHGFKCLYQAFFACPIAGASVPTHFHPQHNTQCLVSLALETSKDAWPWPVLFRIELPEQGIVERTGDTVQEKLTLKWEENTQKPKSIVAVFSASGDQVFVGGPNGSIHVFENGKPVQVQSPVSRKGFVQRLALSDNGRLALMQVTDKVIHLLEVVEKGTFVHKLDLQDSVEGTRWSSCILSPDAEYIIGACSKTHTLHVWNVLGRHMAKLPSPTHGFVRDLLWHPCRPLVVSLGRDGQLYFWSTHRSESWSAFAPNFIQLEENIEYHEREDEFDKNARSNASSTLHNLVHGTDDPEVAVVVDITGVEGSGYATEFYLPFVPENSDLLIF